MSYFRPVTGGADQDEEEDVDGERVKDSADGAFRDGDARGLELPWGEIWTKSQRQGHLLNLGTLTVNPHLFLNITLNSDM